MGRLDGHVAVITGGARGQGATEARLFAKEGAAVAVCDVLADQGKALASELSADGAAVRFFPLDVAAEDQWVRTVAEILAWAGKITILVNNAGIINQLGILETPIDKWDRVMAVNITGPFLGIKHVAPAMKKAGAGSIINVASLASYVGVKCAAYVSSKTALLGLTRTAALELVEMGIRVNAICPGTILTDLNRHFGHFDAMLQAAPVRRHGTLDEIANLVLFLASDESRYITGADIKIDGGFVASGGLKLVQRLAANASALDAMMDG